MNLECFACGQRFRSMSAEARHRHNFPALCKRNKRFRAWEAEIAQAKEPKVIGWDLAKHASEGQRNATAGGSEPRSEA